MNLKTEASPPAVLFFVPVGVGDMSLMKQNVVALSHSYSLIEFFFAHFDGERGREAYLKESWYRHFVGNHSCAYRASKAEFIYQELAFENKIRVDPWLSKFKYIWMSDGLLFPLSCLFTYK